MNTRETVLWTASRLIGYKLFSEVVVKSSTLLLLLVAARLLNREEFGLLSLGFLSGWLLSLGSDFGLQIYLSREVALLPNKAINILSQVVTIRLLLGAALFICFASFVFLADWPSSPVAFVLVAGGQMMAALVEFFNYFYRGLSRSDLESSINAVYRPITTLLVCGALFIDHNLVTLGAVLLACNTLTLLVTVRLAWRLGRAAGRAHTPQVKLTANEFISRLGKVREVVPIGIGILLSALYFRSDLYLIQWWRGLEAVALYDAVFRLVEALRFIPAAVMAVVFPSLCREEGTRVLLTCCLGLAASALLAAVVINWQAELMVRILYGEGFLAAGPAFRILSWALPLLFVNFVLTHQLIAWKLQRFYAIICAVGLMANLLMNILLIPSHGIQGAALATLLTEVFLTTVCVWTVLKRKKRVKSKVSTGPTRERPVGQGRPS